MNYNSLRSLIEKNIKNVGVGGTIYDLTFRAINRAAYFRILKGMKISLVNPGFLETDNKSYKCGFLTKEQLYEFAKNSDYELTESFLKSALEKGDECFGILDGNTLASYGWYSNKPTDITDELCLHFNAEHIYMYKGFTHVDYRGQRLHAIGMNLALREYLNRGFKGLVSYVESNNFASLKSCYRMGYQDFGDVYILKMSGRHVIFSSPGCKEYGFLVKEKVQTPLLNKYQINTEVDQAAQTPPIKVRV